MVYVMANIHGNYPAFGEMLKQINFSDDDSLYLAGDLVDFGESPMELLCDISMRPNVFPIAGEHDLLALRMLTKFDRFLREGGTPDAKYAAEMKAWMANGGAPTFEGFRALDDDMKEGILDYLSEMTLFEEVEVKKKNYLIVHAGIDADADKPLDELDPAAFLTKPLDPTAEFYPDKTVIVGHTPTKELPDADENMIYYGEGSVFLDCGSSRGGVLGCLCLDNGKEYYV